MRWTAAGAISALLAVALGAFGAHGLKARLSPEAMNAYEVGVRYQMYHALALLAVGWLSERAPGARVAGWCFVAGTLLFSGSLYGLSLTGLRAFGPVTPLGGVLFMVGWAMMAWQVLRTAGRRDGR